jgi:uncharacterized protein (DUF58 family)
MNKKFFLLVFILCGLILSALIVRNGDLLLLAMPFLVYLIVGVIRTPSELSLLAKRSMDKRSVIAQEIVETRILVKNKGNALVNLYLKDTLFPSMKILDGEAHQRIYLSSGGTTELNFRFKAARGVYSWKTIRACASDPFGLFDLECDIPAVGEILFRPAPLRIRSINPKPRFTLHAAGPVSARLAGPGTDFWGVREYRAGDSLRRLNWRLAARHPQKLFTNEYEREEIADFGFILDTRKLSSADVLEESLFEYSVSAVASLAESFLKDGNRVSLLVLGKSITSVFPGYGKRQLNLLLRSLARAKLGAYIPFNTFEYLPTRLFPTRSVIIVFSTVHSSDLDIYARLRSFGYDVLLISPDPVDFAAQMLPLTEINSLAFRAARVERVIQLKQLLKFGVKVVDWQVNKPLETIVHKTVNHLMHRRKI